MKKVLHILQHALGLKEFGEGNQFRNHFVTGPGSSDYSICQTLVEMEFMEIRPMNKALTGGSECFIVTPKGIDYVALNSPQKPPEPKLTRSQKNYQDYLDADTGFSFGEWMRFDKSSSSDDVKQYPRERC